MSQNNSSLSFHKNAYGKMWNSDVILIKQCIKLYEPVLPEAM